MREREWLEAQQEAIARQGRKPSRRKRFKVVKLPDDPRIKSKRSGTMSLASRAPMRGDRIGESEDAVWLNVGRVVEDAPGKISGKPLQ